MFGKRWINEGRFVDFGSTSAFYKWTASSDLVLIAYASSEGSGETARILRIRAVSPEPSLLAHTSSESRGTLRQKARSLAQLNGWACAVEICNDGMLEDTNSLDGAQVYVLRIRTTRSPRWINVDKILNITVVIIVLLIIIQHIPLNYLRPPDEGFKYAVLHKSTSPHKSVYFIDRICSIMALLCVDFNSGKIVLL